MVIAQLVYEPVDRKTKGRESRRGRVILWKRGRAIVFDNRDDLKRYAEKVREQMR